MKKFIIVFIAFFMLSIFDADGQRWKRLRYEVCYGLGASNFLGDLGGADKIGAGGFQDLELSLTRYVLNVGGRYRLMSWLAMKGSLNIGMIKGDDKLTNEVSRQYRNLSFKSPIVELAAVVEVSVIQEKAGSRYRIKGVKGRRGLALNTFPYIGIAAFYFNPKAEYKGVWHALQPLTTEGQGQFETRKKYSRFQIAIPIGIGFKYALDRRWSISLDYGIRKTFTDYLDDVSMTYADSADIIRGTMGDRNTALALADPSDGTEPGKTKAGQQRGNPNNNDTYMFAIVSLNYKFRKIKKLRRSRPKF